MNFLDIDISGIEFYSQYAERRFNTLLYPKGTIFYLPDFGEDFHQHNNFAEGCLSYDYFTLNYPGIGGSPWYNPNQLTIVHYANIVANFIMRRSLSDVILMGHGMGAAVAALVNQLIPEQIGCNIFISPIDHTFIIDANQINQIIIPGSLENYHQLQRLKINDYDKDAKTHRGLANANFDLANYAEWHDALDLILSFLSNDEIINLFESSYSSITKPTLLIFGDSDGLLKVKDVKTNLTSKIRGAESCVIPLAGHSPNIENVYNYTHKINMFLNRFNVYNEQLHNNLPASMNPIASPKKNAPTLKPKNRAQNQMIRPNQINISQKFRK